LQNLRTVAAETFGCRLNQSDTGLIFDRLQRSGFEIVKSNSPQIDLFVINSCAVTELAVKKSRQLSKKIKTKHPNCCIVFTGCSVEPDAKNLLKEANIDIILSDRKQIVSKVQEYFKEQKSAEFAQNNTLVFTENAKALFPFNSRAFLKIQEGCNNYCSYCIVPYVRGREKSRDYNEIIEEFQQFILDGYKEIVLTGVNVNSYNHNKMNLAKLVAKLASLEGDFRIRLSSTEPNLNNKEIIEVISQNKKVCNYLHLSLQHGSDNILKQMNRKYTTAEFANYIEFAREKIPDLHIGTDIIVGFPGETEDDFELMLKFVNKIKFATTHIFRYSPRKGTPAAEFANQVPAITAKKRYDILKKITEKHSAKFANSQIGKVLQVLIEKEDDVYSSGWSDNYLKVHTNLLTIKNTLVNLNIKSVDGSICQS